VPAGPVNDIADIFADRQYHARRNLTAVDYDADGDVLMVPSVLPRLSQTPGRIDSLGPRLGEHTDEVLASLLDLSDGELEELRARRVI
jgi:succinyl-CoA:(S)-malate CoA-transferase subunit B